MRFLLLCSYKKTILYLISFFFTPHIFYSDHAFRLFVRSFVHSVGII